MKRIGNDIFRITDFVQPFAYWNMEKRTFAELQVQKFPRSPIQFFVCDILLPGPIGQLQALASVFLAQDAGNKLRIGYFGVFPKQFLFIERIIQEKL